MDIPEPDLTLLRESGMLEGVEILPGGHCSRVYANGERVLKVPFQGEEMSSGWKAALAMSRRQSGVDVLDYREDSGAVWMKRVRPGTPLADSGLGFDVMRAIFIDLFLGLVGADASDCSPLVHYFESSSKRTEAAELDRTAPLRGFLHGDLHHSNILDGGSQWVLIDPKGLEGDIHYELIAWLRNPIGRLYNVENLTSHVGHELEVLCERLSLDPLRVVKWGVIDSDGHSDPDHPWAKLPAVYRELCKGF